MRVTPRMNLCVCVCVSAMKQDMTAKCGDREFNIIMKNNQFKCFVTVVTLHV